MSLPKMAYFMHVHWNWIKQRPHFLFEELTRYYSIDLYYVNKLIDQNKFKFSNTKNVYSKSNTKELIKLPLSSRYKSIHYIEQMINYKISKFNSEDYEYIWITSPIILQFIPSSLLEGKKVIYDCMDDYLEFTPVKKSLEKNRSYEIELIKYCRHIFASSNTLKHKLMTNYKDYLNTVPICINNGISEKFINLNYESPTYKLNKNYNIMYIGTIGDWLDFELILTILNTFSDIIVTLIGPLETETPNHPRLQKVGAVAHELLPIYAQEADAFIMPFLLNQLVLGVDPVKLYEYISFLKPVISIDYEETQKFLPYVTLYSNKTEALNVINDLKSNNFNIYDQEIYKSEIKDFLIKNTWTMRAKEINRFIQN